MLPFLRTRVPLAWLYLASVAAAAGLLVWLLVWSAPPRGATLVERSPRPTLVAVTPAPAVLDLNRATAPELETLPEIGPALAARIVEYRAAHGPFGSVDDLASVPGIKAATVDKLRAYVAVGP